MLLAGLACAKDRLASAICARLQWRCDLEPLSGVRANLQNLLAVAHLVPS